MKRLAETPKVLRGVAVFGLLLGAWLPCSASTFHVPSDYPTIQAGIDAAAMGDVVLVAPGSYADFQTRTLPGGDQWTACVFLKNGVVVRSEGGSEATEIDLSGITGPQAIAVIARLLPSTTTALEGFTLRGPRALGTYVYICGNVTIRDCKYLDFDGGPTSGGALLSNSNVTIVDCLFDNCRANIGGAIWHSQDHITLQSTTFRNSGNVAVFLNETAITDALLATISNCQFIDNWSGSGGAGALRVGVAHGGVSTISDCLFMGNGTNPAFPISGGALQVSGGAKSIERCVFIGNHTAGLGAAIRGNTGVDPFIIRGNTFVNNSKNENIADGSVFDIGYCQFENNIVVGSQGGAVFQQSAYLETACNVFWDNSRGVGYPLSPTDRIVDPLFCDRDVYDLTLRVGSPCLPEDPLGCGFIGAFGQGCGSVSVDAKSWGSIKELYRLETK